MDVGGFPARWTCQLATHPWLKARYNAGQVTLRRYFIGVFLIYSTPQQTTLVTVWWAKGVLTWYYVCRHSSRHSAAVWGSALFAPSDSSSLPEKWTNFGKNSPREASAKVVGIHPHAKIASVLPVSPVAFTKVEEPTPGAPPWISCLAICSPAETVCLTLTLYFCKSSSLLDIHIVQFTSTSCTSAERCRPVYFIYVFWDTTGISPPYTFLHRCRSEVNRMRLLFRLKLSV